MSEQSLQPCVFFDRDGIVNRSPGPGYVERPEEFHVLPGFIDALRVVSSKGYPAVLITNQRGVARGFMTMDALEAIHHKLRRTLLDEKLNVLDIYVCPHEKGHPDRKPSPRMIQRAAREHRLDLSRSWMVGDRETDVEAGRGAGCRTILVSENSERSQADVCLRSMDELAGYFEKYLPEAERSMT